jgi:hypothetical protein
MNTRFSSTVSTFTHARALPTFALLALAALAGCTSSTGETPAPPPAQESTPASPDAGADAALAAATITFKVKLVDARAPDTLLAGIEVCAADRADIPCATSAADGTVTMALPRDSELMLRCKNDRYGPVYMTWSIEKKDIDAGTFSLLEKSAIDLFITYSGGKPSADKGAITVNVYDDLVNRNKRVAGATFTITPKKGGGPVYVGPAMLPDTDLIASTEGGPGLFFDLDPSEVTIAIEHPTLKCTGGFGWKTDKPNALRSRIFGGGLSSVTFVCVP